LCGPDKEKCGPKRWGTVVRQVSSRRGKRGKGRIRISINAVSRKRKSREIPLHVKGKNETAGEKDSTFLREGKYPVGFAAPHKHIVGRCRSSPSESVWPKVRVVGARKNGY